MSGKFDAPLLAGSWAFRLLGRSGETKTSRSNPDKEKRRRRCWRQRGGEEGGRGRGRAKGGWTKGREVNLLHKAESTEFNWRRFIRPIERALRSASDEAENGRITKSPLASHTVPSVILYLHTYSEHFFLKSLSPPCNPHFHPPKQGVT